MSNNFSNYENLFSSYVANYLGSDKRDPEIITTKIHHTFRVVENARYLVEREKLSGTDKQNALLAALFHDIGRFSQFEDYGTFLDQRSVNHARRGVAVLKNNTFLNSISKENRKLVFAAVELHNRRELPCKISEQLRTICTIVRDSDKLDIFKVILDHLESTLPIDPAIVLNVAFHPDRYTRKIYDQVMAKSSCGYEEMKWSNDFLLMLASWVPLLNFSSSYELLAKSGNYERLFRQLPQTKDFRVLKNRLDECFQLIE